MKTPDKKKTVLPTNRRYFLSSLGALGMSSLLPFPILAENVLAENSALTESAEILKTGPYLQAPKENGITIRWLTQVPTHSWVEYGTELNKLDKMAQTVSNGQVKANNFIHSIEIPHLDSGAKYYYRICSKEITDFQPYKVQFGDTYKSEIHSFKTLSPEADGVSFLVYNDIHDRPDSFAELFRQVETEDLDFVHLNGDMFDYQVDENQLVEHLLTPVGQLFSKEVPFLFGCGNHETRGKFSRQLPQYFNSNEGSKYYFSFQQGPAYFIVLDSGEDKEDSAPVYAGMVEYDAYREQQAEWLKREIEKPEFKNAKYKIVFSHIPTYHSGDWHGTMHCRKVWGPILNEAGIDVMISGHTHRYGVHPPEEGRHNYPILIGGGPKEGQRTIIKGVADGNSLELEMKDDQGLVVGSLKI